MKYKQKSIYIKSIELAIENGYKISYNDLLTRIKKNHNELFNENSYESYFRFWFFSNFYSPLFIKLKNSPTFSLDLTYREFINNELTITYETLEYYYNYQRIKETKKISITAIVIALVSIFVQILIRNN